MSRPVFVCIPGHSHSARVFEPLKAALGVHGYSTYPVDLPSVGGNPPTYDFAEDVATIRNIITQLANTGVDIIMLMVGYGSLSAGDALQGLSKRERMQRGLAGGVVRMILVMALIPKEGYQPSQRGDVSSLDSYLRPDLKKGVVTMDPKEAVSIFYNDMPFRDAEYWASQIRPQSIGLFWSRATYAAWRYIPTTYVLCGRDNCINPEYAEMLLRDAQESQPNMIDSVERCEWAGHWCVLSQVQWTVDMLRRRAGERMGT